MRTWVRTMPVVTTLVASKSFARARVREKTPRTSPRTLRTCIVKRSALPGNRWGWYAVRPRLHLPEHRFHQAVGRRLAVIHASLSYEPGYSGILP